MFKAKYIGKLKHLIGESALCRIVDGTLLVQFDNKELTVNGKPIKWTEVEDGTRVEFIQNSWLCLGFGWHKFSKRDFTRIWDELDEGGRFERLTSISDAVNVLKQARGEVV